MRNITPVLLILFLYQATALAEYFVIDQFDVQIRIHKEGYFEVTETIDVTFSSPRHGIYRTIPYRYHIEGEKYDIRLYDIAVEGWRFKRERKNGRLRVRIGDPDKYVDGAQRYVIRYKVERAWLFEEKHTEFYWNLTGNEWEVPIGAISFRIQLPESVSLSSEDYQVFTGSRGGQGQEANISWRDGVLSGQSTRSFSPGEGLTVAIRLPASLIERPTAMDSFLRDYGLLGLPAALLGLLSWLFFRFGQDKSFVQMARYYPPEGLPPAEAGAFIDDKTDNRDITALIPYWAGQGHLTIRETKEEKLFGLLSDDDFELSKLKNLSEGRPSYEYTIFNRLFRDGDKVRISDLREEFHQAMSLACSQIQEKVRHRQLHTPESRKIWWLLPVAGVICLVLAVFFIFIEQAPAAVGMGLAGGLAFLLRRPMLKKNKEGMALYQQLYGFRMFVDKADRPRLEKLLEEDPSYFEKTLPFAIAFGMAQNWATRFEGLFTEPPNWYIASYHHRTTGNSFESFASSFESGMQQVESAFTSTPGSSSGVGGSSGGGFGGGGGGSW